ncbi:hypothetical protein Ssi03_77570 [Sphaerisporangium siamense]|nr:hypothetical protein Ssi03_77570 [Sphaerisporangium siamense]
MATSSKDGKSPKSPKSPKSAGFGKSGKGSPNDVRTAKVGSCRRHPGTLSSGSCPACQRENAAKK